MITVRLGNELVTDQVQNLTWSNADPGGYETCTFTLPNHRAGDHIGDRVAIYEALTIIFYGRVDEPGSDYTRIGAQEFACVGYRALLSDNQTSMVFIDRDLTAWGSSGRSRQAQLLSAVRDPFGTPEVAPDPTTGTTAIKLSVQGPINGAGGGQCEAWYDAGLGNLVNTVILSLPTGTNLTSWNTELYGSVGDAGAFTSAIFSQSGNTVRALATYSLGADRRFVLVLLARTSSDATNAEHIRFVEHLAVIGNHGLTVQGAAGSEGYYPADIVQWVEDQIANLDGNIAIDPNLFIAVQSAYKTPVPYEQIVDDMAKLLGWHWGVWEPNGLLSDAAVLYFQPPPTNATASVYIKDVTGLQLSQQVSQMYNQVRVHFTDVAGSPAYTVVTRSVPRLGNLVRTADVDLGTASLSVAQQYGADYLALLESSGRAAGQCVLPPTVMTTNGPIQSHMLKAGRDRLKLVGIQDTTSSLIAIDSRRFDTFHISRVSCAQQVGGGVVTTVELDIGANLLDVLNARLAIATNLAGV